MVRYFVLAGVLIVFALPFFTPQFSIAQNAPVTEVVLPSALSSPSLDDAKNTADIKQYLAAMEEKIEKEVAKLVETTEPNPTILAGFFKRKGEYFLAAGNKALKITESDDDREFGYSLKIQGFKMLTQQQRLIALEKLRTENKLDEKDPQYREKMMPLFLKVQQMETDAQKDFDALITEIEKTGKFQDLVLQEQFDRFSNKAMTCSVCFSPELFEQLKTEAKEWATKPIPQPEKPLLMLIRIAESAGVSNDGTPQQLKTIEEITAFINSPQCTFPAEKKKQLVDVLGKFTKTAAGGDLAIYGKTLDDKDFDWAALRKKVVLVIFTADWCGPCHEQLPALRTLYDKYKAKGFEIVSVYVAERGEGNVKKFVTDEKLPWIVISETLTKASGKTGQGEEYMVSQVPTTYLVGKDGRTLEQIPTVEVLDEKLAALLGQ